MSKIEKKKLQIKKLRISKEGVKNTALKVVNKVRSLKLSDIKKYRKKLHDRRLEKQEAFKNSELGKNLAALSVQMNRFSLLLHAIWAVIINFVIEAMSRHSIIAAWQYFDYSTKAFMYNAFMIFMTLE